MNKISNFRRFSSRLGLNFKAIKTIESSLKKNKGNLFLVGGSVRDLILNEKILNVWFEKCIFEQNKSSKFVEK